MEVSLIHTTPDRNQLTRESVTPPLNINSAPTRLSPLPSCPLKLRVLEGGLTGRIPLNHFKSTRRCNPAERRWRREKGKWEKKTR